MKATLYTGTKDLEYKEIPKPVKTADDAIVKLSYAGICGTDMMIYFGLHPRAQSPLIMGHEFSGIIEDAPAGSGFKKGELVVINPLISCNACHPCHSGNQHICDNLKYLGIDFDGGFSEYIKVPVKNIYKLPSEIQSDTAALIEPLAVAIHTVRRSTLKVGDTVTILGAGPIGLLIAIIAKKAGAKEIIISDISEYRLNLAHSLGFTTVDAKKESILDVVNRHTSNIGADVVFEVAGNQITANQMISAIKSQGEIMVVSVYKKPPEIDLAKMHFREISLSTTRCFTINDFETAIQFLKEKEFDLAPIISHKLPLSEANHGFKLMEESTESMKILFHI